MLEIVEWSIPYVNTLPQCNPASVGLAQARPNYTYKLTSNVNINNLMFIWICEGSDLRGFGLARFGLARVYCTGKLESKIQNPES